MSRRMIRISAMKPPPMYMRSPFDCRLSHSTIEGRRNRVRDVCGTFATAMERMTNLKGGTHAPAWSEEGHEASTAVRAHQGLARGARRLGGHGRGDRGADRQQGARPARRVEDGIAPLEDRHLVRPARRSPGQPPRA